MPLPIIDMAGLRSSDPDEWTSVAAAIRAACTERGFFRLVGHGIPPERLQQVLEQGRRVFALPLEQKQAVAIGNSPSHQGYEKMHGQVFEPGLPPDLKEGYAFGGAATDPLRPADLPGWHEALDAYVGELKAAARLLMGGIALSLGIDRDFFDPFMAEPVIATLRLLHYPSQAGSAPAGEKGCGAHTDWGAITMLLQDDVGGLQVQDHDRGWIDVPPVPGTLIVNLGDLMPPWTNGLYRSTVHRVINRTGRERYSAAFFFDGNPDYVTRCIPTCLAPGEVSRVPSRSVREHLAHMMALTKAA